MRRVGQAVSPPSALTWIAALALAAVALVGLAGVAAAQQDPRIVRGRQFAEANCALCHQIGRFGDSPLAIAPPFRTLHERYPVEELEEALAEGVVTGHPTMPQFQLDAAQIADFIAYLKSLER
jgi:mono/diheme cytochrome c family protein